jgi:rod shape determining protein RodA
MKFTKFVSVFDYILFFSSICLAVIGILFIYSANLTKDIEVQSQYIKQITFFIISIIIFIFILSVPTKSFKSSALILYIIFMIGLILTLFFPEIKGQRRFSINLGSLQISLQFSEFMKIAVILFLSKYFSENKNNIRKLSTYLKAILITFIPMFFILIQNDLGTLLVYLPILLGISFIAGIKKRYLFYTLLLIFVIGLIPFIDAYNMAFFKGENRVLNLFNNIQYIVVFLTALTVTVGLALLGYLNIIKGINEKFRNIFYWYIFISSIIIIGLFISLAVDYKIRDTYQMDRIKIFIKPDLAIDSSSYNIIQSQTTIGNGGLFGKGWCKGDQIQNKILPEPATDFIFPVIAEEIGFFGSLFVLVLYSLIFYRGYIIVLNARSYFETYVVIGILSMFLFHIFQNIGMAIGIMPITGIPLPFLSYGGSFLMSCFMGVAIMLNIELNRYKY